MSVLVIIHRPSFRTWDGVRASVCQRDCYSLANNLPNQLYGRLVVTACW